MKILLFTCLAICALSSQIESIDGILQLNRRNFYEAVEQNPRLLVKFYIDTCGYCKKMKPVFIQLADKLKDYGFVLAEVNANEHKALAAKNDAKGYPTLKLFRDGEAIDFPNSSDSLEMLFEFALQHAYPLVTKLSTQQEIDLFLKRSNIAVIKFIENNEDIAGVAVQYLQIKFATINNVEISRAHAHKYALYNKDFTQPLFFDGNLEDLQQWVNLNAYPLVFTLNEEEFMKAEQDKINLIGVSAKKNEYLHKRINYIAEQFKDQIRFVIIDPVLELCNRRFEFLIKKSQVEPKTFYYYDYETKKTTTANYDDEQVGSLKKVILDLIDVATKPQQEAKKAAEYLNGNGQVNILTTENFNKQVFENKRHVFVKFYAPWCGHCKNLAPTFEELAQTLDRDDIVIAEVDHTQNQIVDIPIEGYPTLYLFKQEEDQKKRIEYEGDRSLSGLKLFLEKHLGKKVNEEQQNDVNEINIVNEGKVINLTSDNFDSIVLQSKQDVLVKFFAPWCGHCKAMATAYVELAEKVGNNQNVLVAEMDWTTQKTNHVDIKGFPTLMFFKKGGQEVQQIRFNGARTVDGLSNFINENSSFNKREDL